ncbi:CTP synthase [Patescibacteria group bacterium]|nr:MAG: CTP synthase [Patescibacteria group bacterium]
MSKCKYIFVSGGVCSGLGKGIVASSIGALLKARKIRVSMQKLDPYLNIDPGTMSPFQHGEVFVLDDGMETDLDLGHYERFIDESLTKFSSVTTGQIYSDVLKKERRGDFLGKTIQIVPHITEQIKAMVQKAAKVSKAEVLICEIGGTVGDIEGQPFLEAIRQLKQTLGEENVFSVHVTLLPFLKASQELKTKPTQASIRELRRLGIQPDMIIARADYEIDQELLEKIALFCDIEKEAVVPSPTLDSIYKVPLNFHELGVERTIAKKLKLKLSEANLDDWIELVGKINQVNRTIKVGLAGKYTDLNDAYMSVVEALKSAGYHHDVKVEIEWVDAERLEEGDLSQLKEISGIVVPGGFGERGIEGKVIAAQYARENNLPYLGLCLGMQIATIEFARNVLKIKNANSSEFAPATKYPVIYIMPEQEKIRKKGGTMRLGAYPCKLKKGTLTYKAYKTDEISERHRHRYEFNNRYKDRMEKAGLIVAGDYLDGKVVEIVENKNHPWFVGVQFHPEFQSRPTKPHPLFRDFVEACLKGSTLV